MRRTKIVATIGPTSSNPDTLIQLLDAGMDMARLNFSHGTHTDHAERIALLRRLAAERARPLAILQDLQGPKIRTGRLEHAKPVQLIAGAPFTITTDEVLGTGSRVGTTYQALPHDVGSGDRILLSDGLIELRVLSTTDDEVRTEVVVGGELREHQGINLPGVNVSAPALTEKDAEDLAFGLSQGIDYVALSFVRRAADIQDIKGRIAASGRNVPVIAKIEKPEALDDIEGILEAADGIMVARGDLGVEMPAEKVPIVQKQLIQFANAVGKPVITATQMLDSMVRNPRPTRAEASDVANAIIDGTDAVMLSGETANGMYPVESVQMMARIAIETEASGLRRAAQPSLKYTLEHQFDPSSAISTAAAAIVESLSVRAIVAFTISGATARMVSRLRPDVPIFAFTTQEETYRRLNLIWGVTPFLCEYVNRLDDLGELVNTMLRARGVAAPGDLVVMTGGHPIAARGSTNFVKVQVVTE